MKTEIIPASSPHALEIAINQLQNGELVVFPTDTVYGLAARAFDPEAIDRLFLVKGRESVKAIPILLGKLSQLPQVTGRIGPLASRLAQRFWPGPLTLVVLGHPGLPANLSPQRTVGVRMPDHPVALALLRQTGPLAVTSANLSGGESTTTAQEVFDQLAGRIPLILDGGRTPGGTPSTVVDCTGDEPVILRSGPITLDKLRDALV
jgi:L-threonylcarbamoyladenylate synthase